MLSKQFITILKQYINTYDPKYWLFEGQMGGQYSASSDFGLRLQEQMLGNLQDFTPFDIHLRRTC
ncbi:MAG: hypothetical protein R2828_08785 [Saprospiraceae bacterium]